MRVFSFAGPHGIGKTTLINSLNFGDIPVAKFVNFDVSDYDGERGQIDRLNKYYRVLRSVAELDGSDFVVLLDRSPYDFYPYAEYRGVIEKIEDDILQLIEVYESLNPTTIILVEPYDYVFVNITNRNRAYVKEEIEMLDYVYERFYSFDFVNSIRGNFLRLRMDAVEPTIRHLLED